MIRLLQLLFLGHIHKWKRIREVDLIHNNAHAGHRYVCECERCGVIRKYDMI